MTTDTTSRTQIRLLRSGLQDDGLHSGSRLAYQLQQGRLLRVRRGVYIEAQEWITAPAWTRFDIAIAATALAGPLPLFCREAALRLHGLPLPYIPKKVAARTAEPGWAGTRKPTRMTGTLPPARYLTKYLAQHSSSRRVGTSDVENIPTQHFEPALASNTTRTQLRRAMQDGEFQWPQVQVAADALAPLGGEGLDYRAEPLGLALADTVPRMSFPDAVIVLDAVKALRPPDLSPWEDYIGSQRLAANWRSAWEFADARAESPAESKSRALFHTLGFRAPSLQSTIRTESGSYRCDFCWEEDQVIGEVDGRIKYYDPALLAGRDPGDVVYAEKLREDALRRAGWIVIRWGWKELQNPQLLARRLVQAGVSRQAAARISQRFSDHPA